MKLITVFLAILLSHSIEAQTFPKDWIGEYSGQMTIGSMSMTKDSLDVQFSLQEIEMDSSWTYKMTYNSPKYGEIIKDYVIRKTGRFPSQFVLDEQDSILIDMTLIDHTFYSVFQIEETVYSTTMSLHGKDIYFDLFVTNIGDPRISRPTADDESDKQEDMKDILSHHTYMHQSVYLKRNE